VVIGVAWPPGRCAVQAGFRLVAGNLASMADAGQRARQLGREELEARIAEQDAVIAQQEGRIAAQDAVIAELRGQVVELQAKLGQNSRNSSKPPSSDGYSKPSPKKRSLRERSGRKPGGQEDHEGAHLARVEVPDRQIPHEPECCEGCGRDLADGEELAGGEWAREDVAVHLGVAIDTATDALQPRTYVVLPAAFGP
jgi:uncharacterized coiled-coil protein SlyX